MAYEKIKTVLVIAGLVLVTGLLCFCGGYAVCSAVTGSDEGDQRRAAIYEAGSANAQNLVSGAAEQLGRVSEEVHVARSAVESSITGFGELRNVSDRIAANSTESAETAGRIEERISNIESILNEAEKKDCVLEKDSVRINSGGSD